MSQAKTPTIQETKKESKETKHSSQKFLNAMKSGTSFKKERISFVDPSTQADFQRLSQSNVSINQISLAKHFEQYQAFASIANLEQFFKEVVLNQFKGNKDSAVRY